MTTVEIIWLVVLTIWLIVLTVLLAQTRRVVRFNARAVLSRHQGDPSGSNWPPKDLGFP
jgi:hypothetical protein